MDTESIYNSCACCKISSTMHFMKSTVFYILMPYIDYHALLTVVSRGDDGCGKMMARVNMQYNMSSGKQTKSCFTYHFLLASPPGKHFQVALILFKACKTVCTKACNSSLQCSVASHGQGSSPRKSRQAIHLHTYELHVYSMLQIHKIITKEQKCSYLRTCKLVHTYLILHVQLGLRQICSPEFRSHDSGGSLVQHACLRAHQKYMYRPWLLRLCPTKQNAWRPGT